MFKENDRVVKARKYSDDQYCRYGGGERSVPIGTKGIIRSNEIPDLVSVEFNNGVCWNVHPSELKHEEERRIINIQ